MSTLGIHYLCLKLRTPNGADTSVIMQDEVRHRPCIVILNNILFEIILKAGVN